jgi:hypothetical protein
MLQKYRQRPANFRGWAAKAMRVRHLPETISRQQSIEYPFS